MTAAVTVDADGQRARSGGRGSLRGRPILGPHLRNRRREVVAVPVLGVEERGRDITLVRFVDPEPSRTIGLVWRSTSPRAQDFEELGRLVSKAWNDGPLAALRTGPRTKKPITAAGS